MRIDVVRVTEIAAHDPRWGGSDRLLPDLSRRPLPSPLTVFMAAPRKAALVCRSGRLAAAEAFTRNLTRTLVIGFLISDPGISSHEVRLFD